MNCIADKSSERRVTSFPMKDLGGSGRNSAYADRSGDAPVSLTFNLVWQIKKKLTFLVLKLPKRSAGSLHCDNSSYSHFPYCDNCTSSHRRDVE